MEEDCQDDYPNSSNPKLDDVDTFENWMALIFFILAIIGGVWVLA